MIHTVPTMKFFNVIACSLLAASLFSSPLTAQTPRPAAPQKPVAKPTPREIVPTFDTLLAADSYKIYGEIRGVGQLIRSNGVNDLLDPVMKLSTPPKEIQTLVRWLNSHADELVTSRILIAGWPSRAKLPQFVCAIEFASAEEAQKFEPQLRQFLPKLVPSPAPTPAASTTPGAVSLKPSDPPAPPYVIKHAGPLVLISEKAVTFKTLRPTGSKLLSEDQNFRQVHDRFATEPAFLYFDVKAIVKQEEEQRLKAQQLYEEQRKKDEAVAATQEKSAQEMGESFEVAHQEPSPEPVGPPDSSTELRSETTTILAEPSGPTPGKAAVDALMSGFFSGVSASKWPDAIGVSLAFDDNSYNVRLLLLNEPQNKGIAIPFIPQLISGPPIAPGAASVLPADTDMLISGSLDFPLIYEGILKTYSDHIALVTTTGQVISGDQGAEAGMPESPFVAYEKFLGIKIKEDLLPMLGNEIAIGVPLKAMVGRSVPTSTPDPADESSLKKPDVKKEPALVIALSVRDKEGLRALIPKIVESMGFKGAGLLGQTERRGDTELVSYANVAGYAFIGDFLIFSADIAATRHVVDSYLNNQTLGSDSRFRNFTRWQPRQVLGQVYVSEGLLETFGEVPPAANQLDEKLRDVMMRLNPVNDPVTYALYNEGLGPMHELHLPRNVLIMLTAGLAVASDEMPVAMNESSAQGILRTIVGAEETYKATKGDGSYGTLEQLIAENLISKEMLSDRGGYKIELTTTNTTFEARAIPMEYGKSGKISYFVDQSAVLRGGDHGGGPATIADKPMD